MPLQGSSCRCAVQSSGGCGEGKQGTLLPFALAALGGAGRSLFCSSNPACPADAAPPWLHPGLPPLQMGGPLLQPLASWSDHTLPVSCLAVGAGDAGAIVVSGSHDRTVKVRSLAGGSGALLRSVALPSPVHSLALDPGEHALYAGCASGSIFEVPLVGGSAADAAADGSGGLEGAAAAAAAAAGGGGAYPALEGHSAAVSCLMFTPDAAYLISGSADHSVRVWELRSRQQVRLLANPVKGPVSALLALPQPPYMQVGAGLQGRIEWVLLHQRRSIS